MSGAGNRRKGAQGERELASLLPGARKISRSGYTGPDLEWRDRHVEVKRRKSGTGFRMIISWLQDAQMVMMREDRGEWIVAMRLDELLDLLEEAGHTPDDGDTFRAQRYG